MRRFCPLLILIGVASLYSATATAQTKFSGTSTCGKPDPQTMLPAGDSADHQYGVEQIKCSWSTPMEIGSDKAKEGLATELVEVRGDKVIFRGFYLVTMESGDKAFIPYRGEGTAKDGKPTDSKGTVMFVGGSGKLKGMSGNGSFSCTAAADGGLSCSVEGEYKLAASAPKTPEPPSGTTVK